MRSEEFSGNIDELSNWEFSALHYSDNTHLRADTSQHSWSIKDNALFSDDNTSDIYANIACRKNSESMSYVNLEAYNSDSNKNDAPAILKMAWGLYLDFDLAFSNLENKTELELNTSFLFVWFYSSHLRVIHADFVDGELDYVGEGEYNVRASTIDLHNYILYLEQNTIAFYIDNLHIYNYTSTYDLSKYNTLCPVRVQEAVIILMTFM